MMQNRSCKDAKSSQSAPYGQLQFPLHIPNDSRRQCKGCWGESTSQKFDGKNAKKFTLKSGVKKKQFNSRQIKVPKSEKLSSSESGLNFLQEGRHEKDMESRAIRFREYGGPSFGLHLLRKSEPLTAIGLFEKLKFKRNSDVGNITMQHQQKIAQPSFFNEVDSEELIKLRELELNPGRVACPPAPSTYRPTKRNAFQNEYLTTNNRAKEGLKYLTITNFPRLKPGIFSTDSIPNLHEIKDVCGRKSHHPKLKERDLGKRLCEAPSMTKELDALYKEYIQMCPDGDEKGEDCRFLHHAPSPHHREPRRSIMKDQNASAADIHHDNRKSIGGGHLVRFDKEVNLISTPFTKVNGIDASLRDTEGRLKLFRHLDERVVGSIGRQEVEPEPERYPLHVRDPKKVPKKTPTQTEQFDWMKTCEHENLEEKTAKQDLARIYFTTEATKLVACCNLPYLDTDTNMFKKMQIGTRPSIPHFFMDRLADEMEVEIKRKEQNKIASIKNEMDAFDEIVKEKKDKDTSRFDPTQVPSEKSLKDLKLKVEIMKRQRERDVQEAAERNRTRRSYFRLMLPCFADVIKNDLIDYSIKRASKLSGEEMMLASDLLMVSNQRDVFNEHQRQYDKDEEELLLTEEETPGDTEKLARDILDVCLDVAVKISNYKEATGKDASEGLCQEWRNVGFYLLNEADTQASGQVEEPVSPDCGRDGLSEHDSDSQNQLRLSEASSTTLDDQYSSGKDDGDENHSRCVVTINTVKNPMSSTASMEGKHPVTSVQVKVTDCHDEDLETALTYDGLFLPMSGSQLTNSSSETLMTGSSASPVASLTDSRGSADTNCGLGVEAAPETTNTPEFEYEEYEGENEHYFDEHGHPVVPVIGSVTVDGTSSAILVDSGLTEDPTEADEGVHVGEVEIQNINNSEDSPEGMKKSRGLQFSESSDKRTGKTGGKSYNTRLKGPKSDGESKVSLKDSIKFALPKGFESKRNPVLRKPTAYHHRHSLDDDMDDDDDDNDVVLDHGEGSINALWLSQGDEEEEVEDVEEDGNEEGDDDVVSTGGTSTTLCTGPPKRKILVYGELGKVSYGVYTAEDEKIFLQHRAKELKEYSETWSKGLNKPPTAFTIREKNFVPFSNQYTGKRLPAFNILDPHIPRPGFNLRMKKLIKMAEEAKLEKNKCAESETQSDLLIPEMKPVDEVKQSVKPTCTEMLKGKSRIRPNWQDEIAEYECQRKEREKLLTEGDFDEDYAKKLGFEALYNTSFRQTYAKMTGRVQIVHDKSSEQEDQSERLHFQRKKTMACIPGPDGTLPDSCIILDSGEGHWNYDPIICHDEGEECPILDRHYLEMLGESLEGEEEEEEEELLDYPIVRNEVIEERQFSIPDVYNE